MCKLFMLLVGLFMWANLLSQDWDNITPDPYNIEIDKDDSYSDFAGDEFLKHDKSLKRVIEFDLEFQNGTNYILTGEDSKYQNYWNKVVKLECTQENATKNSLRLGWRFIADANNINYNKIELGFYGHLNHIQNLLNDGIPGREFTSLGVFVNQFQSIHVEMVFSKFDYYVRVAGVGIHICRDIFSWESNEEDTQIRLDAYFGDLLDAKEVWYLLTPQQQDDVKIKNFQAESSMHFKVSNIKVDRASYNANFNQNKAPILNFLNTIFYNDNDITYIAQNQINLSICGSDEKNARLPYSYVNSNYSFTVFESGSHIVMKSPSIIFNPGTEIQLGAECIFTPQ